VKTELGTDALRSPVRATLVTASLGVLVVGVVSGISMRGAAVIVIAVTLFALVGTRIVRWQNLVGAL